MEENMRMCVYPGYEGYMVYSDGRVRGVKGYFLKLWIGRGGYLKASLWSKGVGKIVYVHRLICECFCPNPLNKKEVNHIDGDKMNNRVGNLEWATSKENHVHAVKTGLMLPILGEKNGKHKLTVSEVLMIRSLKSISYPILAKRFGVTKSAIQHVRQRRNWKHLPEGVIYV